MARCSHRAKVVGAFMLVGVLHVCSYNAMSAESAVGSARLAGCEAYAADPVLFVHGTGMDSSVWRPLIGFLKSRGYPSEYLYAVDLVPNDGDNVAAAELQIPAAIELLEIRSAAARMNAGCGEGNQEAISIVAHSMGAFSGRWYVARIAPEKVRVFVGLAGANRGTNALCSLSSAGNDQMCPAFAASYSESHAQATLNGTAAKPLDETPFGRGRDSADRTRIPPDSSRDIVYLTLRLDPDEWIDPANSAVLDGAGGITLHLADKVPVSQTSPGNFLYLGRTTHDDLPGADGVPQFVFAALTTLEE